MPRVTVVIPAYNAARWLPETLDSVLAQTFADHETLVIDDGSTDDSAAVASSFGKRVRVIQQTNRGMSATRNRGIEASDSEFVALLDNDDVWHPRKLELQIQHLERASDVGLCYSEFFIWDGLAPPRFADPVDDSLDERLSGWIYQQMVLTNYVLPSSAVFRRASIAPLGLFNCDDHQTDDWEYTVRASRIFPFAKLRAPLVAYRQTPGSLSKRPTPTNVGEAMRENLITRFGLTSPQGVAVDAEQLRQRRYKGRSDFAAKHLARGELYTGVTEFARLTMDGPNRAATCVTLLKAGFRRVFPKS